MIVGNAPLSVLSVISNRIVVIERGIDFESGSSEEWMFSSNLLLVEREGGLWVFIHTK